DAAVAIDPRAEMDHRAVPRIRDLQLVGVPEQRAHRLLRGAREEDERVLVEREAFPAEVAADVRRMHDDRLRRQVERLRHLLAQRERRLVRAYDMRDVALDPHQGRTRLDVRLMDWRHAESVFEDPRSLRESAGNIA